MTPTADLFPYMPRVLNRHIDGVPSGAVYVGRGTYWGNEFEIGVDGDRNDVCEQYEKKHGADPVFIARAQRELGGKSLVCSCHPRRCHAHWLIRIANPQTYKGNR